METFVMALCYIADDLFNTKDDFIAHGCNSHGVMGRGVAKQVKAYFPEAFFIYEKYCKEQIQMFRRTEILGNVVAVKCLDVRNLDNEKYILNCITQLDYGPSDYQYVSYDAMDSCMEEINVILGSHDAVAVSMPKIGAGLGGGQWPAIEEIIKYRLKNFVVNIYTGDRP
jgi:O-acetyl-ADP-ribose deacetylase (regulator of RNase III)